MPVSSVNCSAILFSGFAKFAATATLIFSSRLKFTDWFCFSALITLPSFTLLFAASKLLACATELEKAVTPRATLALTKISMAKLTKLESRIAKEQTITFCAST